jgi:hypothetical protein
MITRMSVIKLSNHCSVKGFDWEVDKMNDFSLFEGLSTGAATNELKREPDISHAKASVLKKMPT